MHRKIAKWLLSKKPLQSKVFHCKTKSSLSKAMMGDENQRVTKSRWAVMNPLTLPFDKPSSKTGLDALLSQRYLRKKKKLFKIKRKERNSTAFSVHRMPLHRYEEKVPSKSEECSKIELSAP